MMDIIDQHRLRIIELCQEHKVERLYVFGSVLSTAFNSQSDVDMVVQIDNDDPLQYTEDYFSLKFSLESLLGRKVDLLEERSISNNTFRNVVNLQKVKIYDRQFESVA